MGKNAIGIAAVLLGVSAVAEANVITDPSPVVTQPPSALPAQTNAAPLTIAFVGSGCDGGVISRTSRRCN
ncbi:hypothetical protein [Pseudomonas kairouanensis]|uniref:hypothetical protein n=1 Tax=Pseudomonas kairouanensis TaxID=2293832 RepID=UPI0010764A63|nr:hypothetical protein [Pseudomonas kairouanensis]